MSIKQGDYLKELRIKNNLSQEKLGAVLGLSRQSISKWEQGYAMPDTENLLKLSELYSVSVDTILKCGEVDEADEKEDIETNENTETEIVKIEEEAKSPSKHKRGWFFISYPILMVLIYAIIGSVFKKDGWITGWLVILTIPLFYTGIIAFEKKKPIIFCYPVLMVILYFLFGFFAHLWHPMWIIFLTIPIFYIICATRKKKK